MSRDARKKEQKRLKREKKKAIIRKAQSGSPYKRIGTVGELEGCYLNSNWRDSGQAAIYVLRRNPAGGHAMAAFFCDLWCAGLKDAWGRLDLMMEDWEEQIDRAMHIQPMEPADIGLVRRLVAGSIRFARQNGFRLPARYDRWTAILGDLGDINNADLSDFGKDGGLLWTGPMSDLRKRLVGCTVEEFFSRPGVHFMAEIDEFGGEFEVEDEEDDEATFEQDVDYWRGFIEQAADRLVEQAVEACRRRNIEPQPRLRDAARLMMVVALAAGDEADRKRNPLLKDLSEEEVEAGTAAAHELAVELMGTPEAPQIEEDLKAGLKQMAEVLPEMSDAKGLKLATEQPAGFGGAGAAVEAGAPEQPSPPASPG